MSWSLSTNDGIIQSENGILLLMYQLYIYKYVFGDDNYIEPITDGFEYSFPTVTYWVNQLVYKDDILAVSGSRGDNEFVLNSYNVNDNTQYLNNFNINKVYDLQHHRCEIIQDHDGYIYARCCDYDTRQPVTKKSTNAFYSNEFIDNPEFVSLSSEPLLDPVYTYSYSMVVDHNNELHIFASYIIFIRR